jgi:hypothetical protein
VEDAEEVEEMEHCRIWCIIRSVEEMPHGGESLDDLIFIADLCSKLARLEVEKLFIMIAGILEMCFCFVVPDNTINRSVVLDFL